MAARPLSGPDAAAVLDAALAVLDADGPDALTVRRVADALGTSTQIVYTRFGGMDGLIAAMAVAVLGEVTRLIEAVPDHADPVWEAVAVARAFRRWSLDHPHRAALLSAPVGDPATHARAKAEAGLSIERVAAPISRAMPLAEPQEVARTAATVWASLIGLIELERAGHLDADDAEERIALLLSRLLRPRT
jgi:AcrR family transcriptional regulator